MYRTSSVHELRESKLPLFHVSNLSVLNFRFFLLMYVSGVTKIRWALMGSVAKCWREVTRDGGIQRCEVTFSRYGFSIMGG